MWILQMAISQSNNESAQLEVATRVLIENPGAVVNVIGRVHGNWARVMDNIKDWVQSVSSRTMCNQRGIHMSNVNSTDKNKLWPMDGNSSVILVRKLCLLHRIIFPHKFLYIEWRYLVTRK